MLSTELKDTIDTLARAIIDSRATGAFTGAGISTESGIPDFRGPQGTWKKMRPIDFSDFLGSAAAREEYWRRSIKSYPRLRDAEPNEGHRALASLHATGQLQTVITQNIDGLHQKAGIPNERVIELHGTNRSISCLECGRVFTWEEVLPSFDDIEAPNPPSCGCGGWLKPATISFGQAMPAETTRLAFTVAARMDVMLVIGSSLLVHPAASVPIETGRNGGQVAIINAEPTVQDDQAQFVLLGQAGEILTALVSAVSALGNT